MKSRDVQIRQIGLLVALSVCLCLGLIGCARHAHLRPLGHTEVIALSADDVVVILQRAGFSDSDILHTGADLRNGLAEFGAAQIESKGRVRCIFSVYGRKVYVTTSEHGSFIYEVEDTTGRSR